MGGNVLELKSERDWKEGFLDGFSKGYDKAKAEFSEEKAALLKEVQEQAAIIAALKAQRTES